LPNLSIGDKVKIAFEPKEKETTPPKHYTIETLYNYLKNPFRAEKAKHAEQDDEAEEYRAMFEGLELGTEATRTSIIENACKSRYIARNKDVYTILPDGKFLIESLARMGIQMDKYKTSTLGQALKKVYRGVMTVDESVALAQEEIQAVFASQNAPLETDTDMGFFGQEVGICPLCGKAVKRGQYGYHCSGYRDGCSFQVGLVICQRVLSAANMKQLLQTGKTAKISGFISKAGKPFDAVLSLQDGKVKFEF
jgi:DNA topoisomerase-3